MTDSLREQLQSSLGNTYSLTRELRGGGMSHVFVASDTALERDVVVKVLPAEAAAALSADRFKREIALAAKLQHPHIVPLLNAGTTATGLPYYTMPFVEGESLRARLTREGEMHVSEAVGILREVARALAYAHERGVVHRDIKPDNVMLSGGSAMVTDFGVAKAVSAAASGEFGREIDAATLTQLGVSLGTPAYMAPEQAAADPNVDRRADLYSFGCMAYEMLTGSPPFAGRTVSNMLAAHMQEQPEPVERRRPSVPPPLAALVMQCLEKHPADRPANATEVLRALDGVVVTPVGMSSSSIAALSSRVYPRRRRGVLARVSAILPWGLPVLVAGVIAWPSLRDRGDATPAPVRFTIERLADEGPLLTETDAAISPDGRHIVYRAAVGSGSRLDMRSVDEFESRPIPGTEGATHPFFSPDGKWLAYFAGGKLLKMPSDGGPATLIADIPASMGASWTSSGEIVVGGATGTRGSGLMRVPAGGGTPTVLTHPDTRTGEVHVAPIVLGDGKTILFESEGGTGVLASNVVAVGSLETGEFTRLDLPAVRPLGIVGDLLVYTRSDGAVMSVPFDVKARRLTDDAKSVGARVADNALTAALSANGTLVYSEGSTMSRVVWIDGHGGTSVVLDEPREYEFPRLSPDGKRLAVTIRGALSTDVWIDDLATSTLTRFTAQGSINDRPEWSADGKRLLFRSTRDSGSAIWWQASDGSGSPQRLTTGSSVWEGVLSPDGSTLLYRETNPGKSGYRLLYTKVSGDRMPHEFVSAPGNLQMPRFSPDGKWVVYQSDESGRFEIVARSFPDQGKRYQISTNGGTEPLWSADGRRIYYRMGTHLVTVSVSTNAELVVGARTLAQLDPTAQPQSRTHPKYDVARDGRVVMPRWVGDGPTLGVVLNWGPGLFAHWKGKP